ncbi:MAG: polysaccharide biosynthesis protein, partial [Planctomycetaceae bacterium]|nr:polysaccharide biosynthesis protein [Planctomycetaceae bacterium]
MTRLAIAVCCYAAVFAVSFVAAFLLRFDFEMTDYATEIFQNSMLLVVLLKVAVVLFSRDWRRRLRYSTIHDVAWSSGVCLVAGILITALQRFHESVPHIPRSVIAIDTILSAAAVASLRVAAHSMRTLMNNHVGVRAERALIYADGNDALSLVSAIQAGSSRLRVVGIVSSKNLTDTPLVSGVRVYDSSCDLKSVIHRTRAKHVLMSSNLPGRIVREISDTCLHHSVEAHLLPALDEIPARRYQLRMRDVTIDDLLRREPNRLDLNEIESVLRGKVVMVTGAAGSIGSEVCRQLLQYGPRKIVLVDQSEFGIFQMEQEFLAMQNDKSVTLPRMEFVLEDITDLQALSRVFMSHRPAVVFHAAAYKHVPLMEHNPQAAVRNNVFGTKNLVDLSDRFAVERFVLISTDKAVRPTNVMGATKLVAEQYLHHVSRTSATRFITVRFGNVLNSAGSVVPTFRRQ